MPHRGEVAEFRQRIKRGATATVTRDTPQPAADATTRVASLGTEQEVLRRGCLTPKRPFCSRRSDNHGYASRPRTRAPRTASRSPRSGGDTARLPAYRSEFAVFRVWCEGRGSSRCPPRLRRSPAYSPARLRLAYFSGLGYASQREKPARRPRYAWRGSATYRRCCRSLNDATPDPEADEAPQPSDRCVVILGSRVLKDGSQSFSAAVPQVASVSMRHRAWLRRPRGRQAANPPGLPARRSTQRRQPDGPF